MLDFGAFPFSQMFQIFVAGTMSSRLIEVGFEGRVVLVDVDSTLFAVGANNLVGTGRELPTGH